MIADRLFPTRLRNAVQVMVDETELPDTNQPEQQRALFDFIVGKELRAYADSLVKPQEQTFKKAYAEQLSEPTDPFELLQVGNLVLNAKVSKPRETFDKDAFIAHIAEVYSLDRAELLTIAANTTKRSAPPVSLTGSIV